MMRGLQDERNKSTTRIINQKMKGGHHKTKQAQPKQSIETINRNNQPKNERRTS